MPQVRSFAPVSDRSARVLILGSMPGAASLAAGQYYAHPHNAFWPILGALVGAGRELSYARRLSRLRSTGIALWDVLQSCERRGSLDAAIATASIVPNDFGAFFAAHPRIRLVACNGSTAFTCYRQHVLPALDGSCRDLPVLRLPSTSPAHAALRLPQKLERWRKALAPWLEPSVRLQRVQRRQD